MLNCSVKFVLRKMFCEQIASRGLLLVVNFLSNAASIVKDAGMAALKTKQIDIECIKFLPNVC